MSYGLRSSGLGIGPVAYVPNSPDRTRGKVGRNLMGTRGASQSRYVGGAAAAGLSAFPNTLRAGGGFALASYDGASAGLGDFLSDLGNSLTTALRTFAGTPTGQQVVTAVQPSLVQAGVTGFGTKLTTAISANPLLFAVGAVAAIALIGRGLR